MFSNSKGMSTDFAINRFDFVKQLNGSITVNSLNTRSLNTKHRSLNRKFFTFSLLHFALLTNASLTLDIFTIFFPKGGKEGTKLCSAINYLPRLHDHFKISLAVFWKPFFSTVQLVMRENRQSQLSEPRSSAPRFPSNFPPPSLFQR